MTRRWLVPLNSILVSITFVAAVFGQSSATPPSEGRSLIPEWFRRHTRQSEPQQETPETSRPNNLRVGSVPPPATLPGLGGSPLPRGDWTPSRNNATARGTSDSSHATNITSHSAVRSDSTGTRQSPALRPTSRFDSEQLRRELSGTFSRSSSHDSPAVRTARNETDPFSSSTPSGMSNDTQSLDVAEESAPAEMPLSQSDIETSPSNGRGSSPPPPTPEPATIAQPEPTPRKTVLSAPNRIDSFESARVERSSSSSSYLMRTPRAEIQRHTTPSLRSKEAFGEALQVASGGDPSVLTSKQIPVITTDIRGPKQILIGREAVYTVRLQNQGTVAAEGIIVNIRIPAWADVVGTSAAQGVVQPLPQATTATQLEWQLARLEGGGHQTLDIRLVPRVSRPLELGVSWMLSPVGSKAIVEVQEPQLKIDVAGPNEVLFEKPQVFRLTLSNPGTGPAENVKIQLVPPGGGQEISHSVGNLAPGESKTVEIELTAREAGKLAMKAIASAEGGLSTDVTRDIFCRKPELEVEWRGPATKYAGTAATYFFRVRNPGTAPAEDVTVTVALPQGTEFAAASEGQTFDAQRREVCWRVGTLGPGDDHYMELKCVLKTPGMSQFRIIAATADGNLNDTGSAETNVVALADLKLEVSDPSGPVAVGTPALYEIRVTNRGASAAKEVNIAAMFSDGVEPDQAEGAMYTVADGRITFRTIEELPAGRDIVLRIRAHAVRPGTHIFRAEVQCRDAEIKLAAEETTRFYADDVTPQASDSASRY